MFPLLKNQSLTRTYISERLSEYFEESEMEGVAAFRQNELVGYIFGELKVDTLRGRHVWVPYEGVAVAAGQGSELVRKLYSFASKAWIENGCFQQYALVPLGEGTYQDAFLGLSFYMEQVHGMMALEDYTPFASEAEVEIRHADSGDRDLLGALSSVIIGHQSIEPTYAPAFPERVRAIEEGYRRLVNDEDSTILLALKDGEGIGFQVYEPCGTGLMLPEKGAELGIAGTFPEHSGKGIGKKLMNEGCKAMKEKGFQAIVTDWRIANLTSSTFWPKCGFYPVAVRMGRLIDSNVTWAKVKE